MLLRKNSVKQKGLQQIKSKHKPSIKQTTNFFQVSPKQITTTHIIIKTRVQRYGSSNQHSSKPQTHSTTTPHKQDTQAKLIKPKTVHSMNINSSTIHSNHSIQKATTESNSASKHNLNCKHNPSNNSSKQPTQQLQLIKPNSSFNNHYKTN